MIYKFLGLYNYANNIKNFHYLKLLREERERERHSKIAALYNFAKYVLFAKKKLTLLLKCLILYLGLY